MPRPFLKTRAKETRSTARPRQVQGQVDVPFMLLTVLLVVIGLIMLLSASYPSAYYDLKGNTGGDPFYYFKRQAVYALLGFGIMYLVSRLNYQGLRGLAVPILVVACLLMLAVKVPGLGIEVSGATRWLKYPVQWQPSELGKMGLILYFASRLSRRDQRTPLSFRRNTAVGRFGNFLERIGFFELIPYFFVILVMIGILAVQHHMSATIQMVVIAAAILFAGGIAVGWFVAGGITVGAALTVIILGTDYMTSRITTWLNPWDDPLDKGMQAIQSLMAIGSGGVTGLGLGNGRQKFLYLPEAQNDFIFAVVCEELGLIGACLILLLFALLIIRGYWLALHARDKFGSLIIVGITTLFAFQVFANVAVVTNLSPNHLDIHKDMQEYIDAKKNIFLHQNAFSRTVLNLDNDITASFTPEVRGQALFFSRRSGPQWGACLTKEGEIVMREGEKETFVMKASDIRIPGDHNVENYLAAICAVWGDVPIDIIRVVARNFGGVEHRAELVRELDGVKWYNDSIGTSPTRTIKGALSLYPQKIILIAGGYDKKIPYDDMGPVVVGKVKKLVLMGATGPKIGEAVRRAPGYAEGKPEICTASSMEEAVALCRKLAEPGDIVTLSPASASFDMYPNFEARGNHFKKLVNELN